ncbi:hypothetical protein [Thermococcus sp.]|uniref:hypothetical protein n=1 Tax=Thermococcus sp. TaxID=35749 RepID=UPI002628577A|nr:hypothetical protein [Thermococcus sp.]
MLGRSIGVDYDRLKRALGPTFSSYKPIPKGSKVELTIPAGSPVGSEFTATFEPDDGYLLDVSYVRITLPDGTEGNVIATTDEGGTPLLAKNTTGTLLLDASDFGALTGLKALALYVKVNQSPSSNVVATLEVGGRQVRWSP